MTTKTIKAKASKKETKKTKSVELPNAKVEKAKKKAVKSTVEKTKASLVEKVTSEREVKYIYPEGCTDILEKKKYRQKVRNTVKKYQAQLGKIEDQDSKEYKRVKKEMRTYMSGKVKSAAVV